MVRSDDFRGRERCTLDLRPISAFDADLLSVLHRAGFGETWDRPWSTQSFADVLAMPGSFGVIAAGAPAKAAVHSNPAEPAGFGLALASGDEVELLLIAVLPSWRRLGIARRMLSGLLDRAAREGAGRAILEVAALNRAAIGFYQQLGFSPCGRRPNYYSPGIDAVIYERILPTGNIRPNT